MFVTLGVLDKSGFWALGGCCSGVGGTNATLGNSGMMDELESPLRLAPLELAKAVDPWEGTEGVRTEVGGFKEGNCAGALFKPGPEPVPKEKGKAEMGGSFAPAWSCAILA